MPDYGDLVRYIVEKLVTRPEGATVVAESNDRGMTVVTIRVDPEDIGRVIGKRGATINSIRLLCKAAAVKSGERVEVDIQEE